MRTRPITPPAPRRDSEFVAHLVEVFHAFGPIQARRMFGGHGLYHAGLMIGLVADDVLYLKADDATLPAFRAAGCTPFEYVKNGKAMKMSYLSAPASIFDDPQQAREWAARAYGAAQRSRVAAKPRRQQLGVRWRLR